MKSPVLPVLGGFLAVVVFGPFFLMFAGPALTRDPEAAQIGLYLLLHVNPVAIPALLMLLGLAWVVRRWSTPPVPAMPPIPAMPAAVCTTPSRVHIRDPHAVSSPRRAVPRRDVIIDVVASRVVDRPRLCNDPRPPASAAR